MTVNFKIFQNILIPYQIPAYWKVITCAQCSLMIFECLLCFCMRRTRVLRYLHRLNDSLLPFNFLFDTYIYILFTIIKLETNSVVNIKESYVLDASYVNWYEYSVSALHVSKLLHYVGIIANIIYSLCYFFCIYLIAVISTSNDCIWCK